MVETDSNRWSSLVAGKVTLALLVAGVGHNLGTVATVRWVLAKTLPVWRVEASTNGISDNIPRIGRSLPGVDCLDKAVVCHVLLEDNGIDSELHLGVAKPSSDVLEAHAWVTVDDRVLVGGDEDLSYYTPLPLEEWP